MNTNEPIMYSILITITISISLFLTFWIVSLTTPMLWRAVVSAIFTITRYEESQFDYVHKKENGKSQSLVLEHIHLMKEEDIVKSVNEEPWFWGTMEVEQCTTPNVSLLIGKHNQRVKKDEAGLCSRLLTMRDITLERQCLFLSVFFKFIAFVLCMVFLKVPPIWMASAVVALCYGFYNRSQKWIDDIFCGIVMNVTGCTYKGCTVIHTSSFGKVVGKVKRVETIFTIIKDMEQEVERALSFQEDHKLIDTMNNIQKSVERTNGGSPVIGEGNCKHGIKSVRTHSKGLGKLHRVPNSVYMGGMLTLLVINNVVLDKAMTSDIRFSERTSV